MPVINDMQHIHNSSERRKKADLVGHIVYNDADLVVFNFGKYKGMSVVEVLQKDQGYFGWLMQADFPLYTKKVLREIRNSMSIP